MTGARARVVFGALAVACALAPDCSQANLDVITAVPDGGTGTGGGSGTGGTGPGGSGTPPCPTTVLKAGNTMETVQVGSTTRNYMLHIPPAYDGKTPVPLIVDYHPISPSAGKGELGSSPYPPLVDQDGVIMAFPIGLSGPSGPAWNVGPCCVANVDDVAFSKRLVEQIQTTACIDAKRVYAVGTSMGGGMAYYLACHAADYFAAVAPAAFDMAKENSADCQPPRPVTVISFRGSDDKIVPYDGDFRRSFRACRSRFSARREPSRSGRRSINAREPRRPKTVTAVPAIRTARVASK